MYSSARSARLLEWVSKPKVQDWLAVVILFGTSLAFFSLALFRGVTFGAYDLQTFWELTHGLYPGIHNAFSGDQAEQFGSWYALDWQLVHHGEFPLWNRYVMLGMPHFTGVEAAALSLPTLVSYLFPLNIAYLVIVIVTLFIAGTGAYFLARCLGFAPAFALFAGIAYELSGPLSNWAGMPLAVVNAWIPWLLAFTYLLLMSPRRRRLHATLLAICVAFTIFGGHPESWLVAGITGGLFFLSLLIIGLVRRQLTARQLGAFALWEGIAIALGACLSAPLLLPAIPVLALANKGPQPYKGLPIDALNGLVAPAYYGSPAIPSFSPFPLNYYETVAYVGSLALILALYAIIKERARTEVLALASTTAIWLLVIFDFGPAQALINAVPKLNTVAFTRGLVPIGLCVGLLGAYGARAFLRHRARYPFDRWMLLLTTCMVAFLVTSALFGAFDDRLTPLERSTRSFSFLGSLALVAALGVAALLRTSASRRALPLACALLIVAEGSFLWLGGVRFNTFTPQYLPRNAAMTQLMNTVGPNLMGTVNVAGPVNFGLVGFLPNINIGYGVRQFAIYDPIVPYTYFESWTQASGQPGVFGSPIFSPSIDNAAVARLYGISYVITGANGQFELTKSADNDLPAIARTGPGDPGQNWAALHLLLYTYISNPYLQYSWPLDNDYPQSVDHLLTWAAQGMPAEFPTLLPVFQPYQRQYQAFSALVEHNPEERQAIQALVQPLPMPGMTLVASTPYYKLYRVPGAAQFSLAGDQGNGTDTNNEIVSSQWLNNYTVRIQVRASSAKTLLIRITNEPGWNAQVNGRPATLHPWRYVMQQLAVPAGESTITLTYWPTGLTRGLQLAGGALVLMVLMWLVPLVLPRKRRDAREENDAAVAPPFSAAFSLPSLPVSQGSTPGGM